MVTACNTQPHNRSQTTTYLHSQVDGSKIAMLILGYCTLLFTKYTQFKLLT